MSNFINAYEIIFMHAYRGYKSQKVDHKGAISDATWMTGFFICLSMAALIKGLIQTLEAQEVVNKLALELGIKNGYMSLIVLVSIMIGVFLVNVFLKMRINNLDIKFKNINISLKLAMAVIFATGLGSGFTFLYVRDNALVLILMQTIVISYLANKYVKKSLNHR